MRWLLLVFVFAIPAHAAEYFVSRHGNDEADGLTTKTAWKTVERVNKADLKPGDVVRFPQTPSKARWSFASRARRTSRSSSRALGMHPAQSSNRATSVSKLAPITS